MESNLLWHAKILCIMDTTGSEFNAPNQLPHAQTNIYFAHKIIYYSDSLVT